MTQNPLETQGLEKKESNLRVWIALFYEESTKPNWREILERNMICCAVSPLHCDDEYEDDEVNEDGTYKHRRGEKKKPHWHIVFQFSGPKSYKQVWDILRLIAIDSAHTPRPERPYSDIKRCVRYLTHIDYPDKAQYPKSDITAICGFDYVRYFRLNSEEEEQVVDAIIGFIEDYKIGEYRDLVIRLRGIKHTSPLYQEMYHYCTKHTIFVAAYLKSYRYSVLERKLAGKTNADGEVIA